jgi:hypothetical protein
VFKGTAESLIDQLCLIIALVFLASLLLKPQSLLSGDVQLGVSTLVSNTSTQVLGQEILRITNLLLTDKGFKSLAEAGDRA